MNLRNFFLKLGNGIPTEEYNELVLINNELGEENEKLKGNETEDQKWENYWNNKRPKVEHFKWIVHETDGNYQIDVRDWLMPYDATPLEIKGNTNDEIAYNCLIWVIDNIKYIEDKKNYGFDEYWAKVYQTIKNKSGDCEDGCNLIHSMMLKSGIPYWRIRGNVGMVNGGYHAYLTYCRETDNQWVILDWCFYPNRLKINERKLHKDEQNYSDEKRNFMVDGSWNLKYCFGEMLTMSNSLIKPLKAKKSIGGKNGKNK